MADLVAHGVRFNVVRLGPNGQGQTGDSSPDPYRDVRLPVVFLHGLIMDNLSSFYYTLAPAVAAKTDTVLYDLRGHGRSERPMSGYAIEDGVDDLFGILDVLGLEEPVHLVGNSYGGTIALAAALLRPERVAGMVLIEPHPAFTGWGAEVMEDLADLVSGFDNPGIREYLADEAPRYLRQMVKRTEDLVTVSSMGDDLRTSQPTDPDRLASVACPTLLLYGENSDIIDRAYLLEETIAGSELVIVDDCSHALLMENPKECELRTTAWLDEQARRALSEEIGAVAG